MNRIFQFLFYHIIEVNINVFTKSITLIVKELKLEQRIFTNSTGKNFTQISNEAIRDENLSWKARGILAYIASHRPDWRVHKSEIMKHSTDKRDSFNSGWDELKKAGYIKGVQVRENGKFKEYVWYVSDDKLYGLPETDFPVSGNPEYGKPTTNNTNNINTNNVNNADTEIDTKSLFLKSYKRGFISENTIRLFLNFGTELECKEYLDIIYQTKYFVESKIKKVKKSYKIEGAIWSEEIEKEAYRFIFKKKEGELKEKEITNLKGYWHTTMKTFWENVFLMEREYGFPQLQYLHSENQLELEDNFFDLKVYFDNEKEWRKSRNDFIYNNII